MSLSFREAVMVPFTSYYKLRPDNAWWSEHNQKTFWYRIIVMITIMMIFVSSISISKNQYPWKLAEEKYQWAKQGFPEMVKDFPLRLIAYPRMWATKFNKLKISEADFALRDNSVRASITGLIRESWHVRYSELGGVVFLKEGRLIFYTLDNPNRLIAEDIEKSLKNDNLLPAKYEQYKKIIQEKFGHERAIKKMGAILENDPDNKLFQRRILSLFAFLCTFDHQVDLEQLLELFYDGSKGKYVGNFHVHQFGDKPSLTDLESSQVEDKFIISDISGYKTTFYWLKGGKIFYEKDVK